MFGIENESPVAKLMQLCLWGVSIIGILSPFALLSKGEDAKEFTSPVPRWVAALADIAMAFYIAHNGWVWTGFAVMVGCVTQQATHSIAEKILNGEEV